MRAFRLDIAIDYTSRACTFGSVLRSEQKATTHTGYVNRPRLWLQPAEQVEIMTALREQHWILRSSSPFSSYETSHSVMVRDVFTAAHRDDSTDIPSAHPFGDRSVEGRMAKDMTYSDQATALSRRPVDFDDLRK